MLCIEYSLPKSAFSADACIGGETHPELGIFAEPFIEIPNEVFYAEPFNEILIIGIFAEFSRLCRMK